MEDLARFKDNSDCSLSIATHSSSGELFGNKNKNKTGNNLKKERKRTKSGNLVFFP
jgi:hypothetical protein